MQILITTIAYLIGSIPTGKIVGRLKHVDIQKVGSGNIGFANVLRNLGWQSGLIVLIGDTIKGFIPVFIALKYLPLQVAYVVGMAAILGHVFPIWLKFKGGKGIATGLGVTLALSPLMGLIGLGVYVLVFFFLRKSAAASLAGAWCLPILALFFAPAYIWFYLALAIFALWTHRMNIQQLMKGRAHVNNA